MTMTDRELLERAAKAAGIAGPIEESGVGSFLYVRNSEASFGMWAPLTDDGDALRLAVKLGLRIYTPDDDDRTAVVRDYTGLHVLETEGDKFAATRRAIVRAAAAMAKED